MKRRCLLNGNVSLCMVGFPAVLGFLCLYILPIGITVGYSLLENSFTLMFVGIDNYVHIWKNEYFHLAIRNTITLTIVLVVCSSIVSISIGYLLHRNSKTVDAGILLLLLPLLIPSGSVASIWKSLFNTSSFSGTVQSYVAITSLFMWKYTGFGAVLIYTGLQRIPVEIVQAAALDGAGNKRIYLHIHLPIMSKELELLILFLLMFAFRIYKESYLLFGEYPCDAMYLVQHYMNNHFMKMNFQYVSSSATSFGILSFSAYGLVYWLMRNSRRKAQ